MYLKNKNIFLKSFSAMLLMSSFGLADVSGTVYRDLPVNGTTLNSYGVKDVNELGVGGISVTAYPENITTATASDGSWSLATTVDSRIEFSNIPTHLKESPDGKNQNSSVQFVTNGEVSTFGIHNPEDFSDTVNPLIVLPSWTNGETTGNTSPALFSFGVTSSGQNSNDPDLPRGSQPSGPVANVDATAQEIGTVWGIAYQKNKQRYFTSTVLRRHAELADGLGYLYVVDTTTVPGSLVHKFNVDGIVTTNGGTIDLGSVCRGGGCENLAGNTGIESDYSVTGGLNTPSVDLDAAQKIGKVAFGGIDMQPNTNFLWAVNLNQKALIKMDVSDDTLANLPNSVDQYLISSLTNVPACTNGEIRPWALKFTEGKGYLGLTCDASNGGTASDLRGYIMSFDPNNLSLGLTAVIDFPFNYERENGALLFRPWTHNFNDYSNIFGNRYAGAQPIVSDMIFDAAGDMVIAILDRAGITMGTSNYTIESESTTLFDGQVTGDIFHACKVANSFVMESSAGCAINFSSTDEGFNSTGEFFEDRAGDNNADSSLGGLAILKGSGHIINSVLDPRPSTSGNNVSVSDFWNTQGVHFYNEENGAIAQYYTTHYSNGREGFGKSAGMGDVELLTAPAPTEVGDRVWEDTDSDGVQDADEQGISSVSVELVCGGVVASTAITDSEGNYIFSNDPNGVSTGSHRYNVTDLVAGSANCLVRIPNVSGGSKQASLGIATLTTADSGEGANSNANDSDGLVNGDNAGVNILASDIPSLGANNHTFDFGFSPKQTVSIGSLIWEDENNDGLQDDSEKGIADVNVTLLDENGTVMTNPAMQTTGVDGQYYFSGLDEGAYSIRVSPPSGMGYVPCVQQTTTDDDNMEDDSNIKSSNSNEYTSGMFTLEADTEPTEANGKSGTDSADDTDDDNGNMTVDFCFYRPASLGDYVWYDDNKDGTQDANETGVENVTVKLLNNCDSGDVAGTLTTGTDGKYLFSNLDAGDYCVEFSNLPTDYVVTTQGAGTATDSDASVTVPYKTASTTLSAGEEDLTWDMGIYSSKAAIGDKVWYDLNANGQQDVGENGVNGLLVKLHDSSCNNELNSTNTDSSGNYIFESLTPGTYCIEFGVPPAGYAVTTQNSGSDDSDSDTDPLTRKTIATLLDAGERDLSWDMGIYPLAEIGDKVWSDTNANGVQDGGENGVSGVTVTLYGADCTTRAKMVDGTTDVPTTITSGVGEYIFSDLAMGDYCVGFSNIPNGYKVSPQNQGGVDTTDSDVDVDTNKTTVTTLDANESDMSWDMGIYQPATIGDKVWNDINANGIQDVGEVGVPNVTVTLYDSSCNVVATDVSGANIPTQQTNASGEYLFEDLVPADYCVGFTTLPAGYAISPQNQGGDNSVNSDVNVTTGKTVATTLDPAEDDRTWDMGIYEEASIGNYVWNDSNANGEQEGTESAVANVTVTLYQADCTTVAKDSLGVDIPVALTDANGLYLFDHLMPAEYCLGFATLPAGFGATFQDTVADTIDSDVSVSSMKTISTVLDAGEDDMTWDMGIFQAASIGDKVWYDNNANGVQDANESGVANVNVTLYQTDCTTVAVDGLGATIPSTQTDVNGNYAFNSLVPNDYCVGFDLGSLPAGYVVSKANESSTTDALDSDVNPNTGKTMSTNLIGGENDTSWDMGIYAPASIGDKVWLDTNANGVQDANESGVANVTVTLYEGDCTTAVILDNDGNAIAQAITGTNGVYAFTNLTPNEYCIGFEDLPLNHVITNINSGSDLLDSDVNSASRKTISTTLDSGENDISWDMGIYLPASIGDKVWLDTNADGIQDSNESGVENIAVTLYESDCTTAVVTDDSGNVITTIQTNANGEYGFSNLTPSEYCVGFDVPVGYIVSSIDQGDDINDSDVNPLTQRTISTVLSSGENDTTWDMGIYKPASIGDKVWDDLDGDGVQDVGEKGVPDVNVTLYNCDCTTFATDINGTAIPSMMTDSNGLYSFDNLQPNDYCVGFTLPTGYIVSPQSASTDDSIDSDVNTETKTTGCTTLSSDENDTTWDMGIYMPASIGDKVWLDDNRDGIQDSNESGVADVNVTLYGADCATELKSMKTDTSGNYLFANLVPNDYCVGFEVPNGYALTLKDTTADMNDSDVEVTTRKTVITTLESGENDMTWDAGIYQLSTLGDYVWYDENHNGFQDANETAVSNVKVVLYESDCETAIDTTRSDASGRYSFTNLEPQEYCVGFEELPVGYQFTPNYDNTGAGTELDCNVDPGTGKTPVITLPHATIDNTWDMGIIPKCEDEEGRSLQIFDDVILASTEGPVTTINILANDFGNLDIESIKFVTSQEAAILHENGTAVGGVNLETVDTLVVKGEGIWEVKSDGTITFTAEKGFSGIPKPVYYIIKCKQGSVSNIAQATITSNCVCETYETKSVNSMNSIGLLLMFLLTVALTLFFFRKELE